MMSSLLTNPFPWVFLSALASGAALSRMTVLPMRKPDPEKARVRKWILFCLYLSLAVILGLAALFIPEPVKILDRRVLFFFLIFTGVFFLALRFKKSLGIPIALLFLTFILLLFFFLQSLIAFSGETEIATVRVISVSASQMKLELMPREAEPVVLGMAGEYFAPVVKVVIFEDIFIFLGIKTWYRFEGMTSFWLEQKGDQKVFHRADTDYYFKKPSGITGTVFFWFERYVKLIPGIHVIQVEIDSRRARELSTYSIRIASGGGVQIVAIS